MAPQILTVKVTFQTKVREREGGKRMDKGRGWGEGEGGKLSAVASQEEQQQSPRLDALSSAADSNTDDVEKDDFHHAFPLSIFHCDSLRGPDTCSSL